MRSTTDPTLVEAVREAARPLSAGLEDYDPMMDLVEDARFVLLGEASHGTHEFYRERARITRRLIEEHGFAAVAVGAAWPDAYRVHHYVRAGRRDGAASAALPGLRRFPTRMVRHTVHA